MPVKYIDIDAIDQPLGEALIKGKTYPVHEMSVRALINVIALSENQDSQNVKLDEYMRRTAEALHEMIPDCPVEVFLDLTMDQMNALMAWARSLKDEEVTSKNEVSPQS